MKKLIIYLGCMIICYTNQSCAVLEVLPDVLDPCGSLETQKTKVENTANRINRNPTNITKADCELIKAEVKKLNDLAKACTTTSASDKADFNDLNNRFTQLDCSGLSIFLQNNDFLN
jgi:hypothetical protein